MDYTLRQRGRACVDFLVDLGIEASRLENKADAYAESVNLTSAQLPENLDELQAQVQPVMQNCLDFRVFRVVREWQLDQHGLIAMDAFDEIRPDIEGAMQKLQEGSTRIQYAENPNVPDYWDGYEFHRSAGGWDGHDYMGFVHGEIIHRKMVGTHLADVIMGQRRATAKMPPVQNPEKILEMGCGSAQYTLALAEAFPDAEIWGCDLSPRQLEEAQRRANEKDLTWRLVETAAEDTGLEAGQFDLVTSYAVFHELPSSIARKVLKETIRLLKPGGVTLVGDVKAYHAHDDYNRWKADFLNQIHGGDPFWREYATTDLATMATDAGFIDAEWFGVGENQYPFVLIARKPD
jgi:SAM-dependent methyltransferase